MTLLIPDTSALINLHDVYVNRTHITMVLKRLFDVQVSTEIVDEMRRHTDKFPGYEQVMLRYVGQIKRPFHRQQDYEKLILDLRPSAHPDKNRGERYNCSLAAYQVRKQAAMQAIMVIDDGSAHRGLITWFDARFKMMTVWSSLDMLQHIYLLSYPEWPLAQALAYVRAVNGRCGGHDPGARLRQANQNLRELDSMLCRLPQVRGRVGYGF